MSNRPIILVAAKILCYINGRLYGRVTSFNWTSNTPRKEIRSIDIMHAVELAATTTGVSFTMGVLRTTGDGGNQGAGIVSQAQDLSREKYFTLLLLDRNTDLHVFKADLCQTDSEAWQIVAKGIISGTVTGKGITWVNESAQ